MLERTITARFYFAKFFCPRRLQELNVHYPTSSAPLASAAVTYRSLHLDGLPESREFWYQSQYLTELHLRVHRWNPATWRLEDERQSGRRHTKLEGRGGMFLTGHRETPYAQLISNVFAQQGDIPSGGPV